MGNGPERAGAERLPVPREIDIMKVMFLDGSVGAGGGCKVRYVQKGRESIRMRGRKKKQIIAAVIAGVLILAMILPLLVASVSAAETAQTAEATVQSGISLEGVDLSGMTREEVEAVAEELLDKRRAAVITLHGMDDENVTVSAGNLGLTWSNSDVVDTIVHYGYAANIIARYKQAKDLEHNGAEFSLELSFNEEQIRTFIENNCSEWNVEAVEASMTRSGGGFQYTEGRSGIRINEDESVRQIVSFLTTEWNGEDATIDLDMDETEPATTVEELQKLTSVLGTFSTSYSQSNAARSKNISNACTMINGMTLAPGESFSMLNTITPFTEENGYALAGSYVGDEVVESFGGGICQVSTTLYNAVIRAELNVTERHNHSMIVTYVDPSADAAIAESAGMDFRFTNNLSSTVYIEGSAYNGTITFTIYGVETRASNRKVSFVSETLSETPSEGYKIKEDASLAVGTVQTTAGHDGLTARLWKVVTVDGAEQSKEIFNNSNYSMSPTYVKVGTAGNVTQALKDAIASADVDAIKTAAADAAAGVDSTQTDELTNQAQDAANAAYADALAQGLDTTTAMEKAQDAANAAISQAENTDAAAGEADAADAEGGTP